VCLAGGDIEVPSAKLHHSNHQLNTQTITPLPLQALHSALHHSPSPAAGPPRDICKLTDDALEGLKAAWPHGQTFFGSGKATQLKCMQRLHDDLRSHVSKINDDANFEVANNRLRKLSAAIELLTVVLSRNVSMANLQQSWTHSFISSAFPLLCTTAALCSG